MITLVNRNSASASEIVSGALQDYDRSLIIGETTFGKALVQSVYRVSGGAGLALTTARYYTPSGRLIQRPWDGTFDEYLTYTMRGSDASAPTSAEQLKYTDRRPQGLQRRRHRARRALRRPGRRLQPDAVRPLALNRGLFASYAEQFYDEGDTRPGTAGEDRKFVEKGFAVDDAMVADFKKFVDRREHQDRRGRLDQGPRVHQGDDPLRDRRVAVFDIATARQHLIERRSAGAVRALKHFPEAEKLSAERSKNDPEGRATRPSRERRRLPPERPANWAVAPRSRVLRYDLPDQ